MSREHHNFLKKLFFLAYFKAIAYNIYVKEKHLEVVE